MHKPAYFDEIESAASGVLADTEVRSLSRILKALSHPTRLRMVDLIRVGGGDVCVCEFENHFELTQPTISHHLRILREAGLIESHPDGTSIRHSINRDTLETALARLSSLATNQQASPRPTK